jgi:dihydrolipoamide dehydrogenase
MFDLTAHDFASLGIIVPTPKLDFAALMKHKSETVSANVNGVGFLLKKNKVDSHFGLGTIVTPNQVRVTADDGSQTLLDTRNIVIATGSEVTPLPGVTIDEKIIVSSTGALELEKVPQHLVVIGAGVIGLELSSVWRRLGAKVTVIEYLDRILPGLDLEVTKQFQRILEKQGIAFELGQKVTKVETQSNSAKVSLEPAQGGAARHIDADIVLVAIGRRAFTAGLGLEEVGIASERGKVIIDDHFRTSIPNIYAIGDVVRGLMLAHKAEDEGMAVAEILAGQHGHVNYQTIPGVVYTQPEIASVGKTEEELKAEKIDYRVGKFPFTANGRARAMRHTDGFVKILADAQTDRILGVHILGAGAGELIGEAVVIMEFAGSAEDLARICHAHPTMSEAVKEAALNVDKRSIHI